MVEATGSGVRNVSRPTILVIDDDRAVVYSLAMVLEAKGFAVLTADDGKAGMGVFHQNRPDIVVTDIIMPNQEGIETIMQMRRARPNTKIIAMSGGGRVGNSDFLEIASKLGADLTLLKPFDGDLLIGTIQKLIQMVPRSRAAVAGA